MATVYVSPLGSGDASGSGVGNAIAFANLHAAILAAGPGGTVLLLADQGVYSTTSPVTISVGGGDGAPVTLKGVDALGNAMDAQITGTRPATYTAGMKTPGNEVFTLVGGADNLSFEGIDFVNVGTAFRLAGDLHNLTIQKMYADNVQIFVGNTALAPATTATVSGLTIRDVEVHGFSLGTIALKYDTNNVLIERVIGDSEYQDKDPAGFAEGIHLNGTVHHVVIKDTTMMNAIRTGSYYNSDGFATERGVYDVRFENTVASGNADGGYDLKSRDTVLVNALAEDNGRNFRLWGEIQLIDPIGIDPHKRGGSSGQYQVQLMNGAQVTVTGGYFVDSGSSTRVVHNDGSAAISFSGTRFVYSSTMTEGPAIAGIDPLLVWHASTTGVFSTDGEKYLTGPMPDPATIITGTTGNDVLQGGAGVDIIAGRAGADTITAGAGDDVIRFSGSGDGADSVNGGTGNDRIEAAATKTVIGLSSVSGVETISANGYSSVTIVGTSASDVLDFTQVTLSGITSISGGNGNDTIYGSAAADLIIGGSGADNLSGNGGADRFDYNALAESRGTTRDRIMDFQHGSDRIDLSSLDAATASSGNQAFKFVAAQSTSVVANSITWYQDSASNKTIVQCDVNGDRVADFSIELAGLQTLSASDFVL